MSPQCEGELELDSASDDDNVNEEVDRSTTHDDATECGPKDYISAVRESSLWISPDVLILRTAGRRWNNAKLYGEFAALCFFLMTNNEEACCSPLPGWPSLCFDCRRNFGFAHSTFESRWLPDMTAFNCSRERT